MSMSDSIKNTLLNSDNYQEIDFQSPTKSLDSTLHNMSFSSPYNPSKYAGSQKQYKQSKFHCDVHGDIILHPVQKALIDTPVFQRLRHQHQLGATYRVYMTATHKRFEHSIGAAYLADKLITNLYNNLPKENKQIYSQTDLLCIKIAALLHDIGHGPYSHLWDDYIVDKGDKDENYLNSDYSETSEDDGISSVSGSQNEKSLILDAKWSHEKGSCLLLDYILETCKNVKEIFKEFQLDKVENLNFIKEAITAKHSTIGDKNIWRYKSRPESHAWLFEIVSNVRSGVDVDRLDYLLRDSIKCGMDHGCKNAMNRYLADSRINNDPNTGRPIITIPEKDRITIFEDVYQLRKKMHGVIYQHKTVKLIEMMTKDILQNADSILCKLTGNPDHCLSKAHKDISIYAILTEDIIGMINYSPGYEKSREIYYRLMTRNLYKYVASTKHYPKIIVKELNLPNCDEILSHVTSQLENLMSSKRLKTEKSNSKLIDLSKSFKNSISLCKQINFDNINSKKRNISNDKFYINPEDFEIITTQIHYGKGCQNPLKDLHYFTKVSKEIKSSENLGVFNLPKYFSSIKYHLIYKNAAGLNEDLGEILSILFYEYFDNVMPESF